MFNRKGAIEFSLKHTAEIILALAVFIVIILLVFFILSPSYGIASEWVCKTSVTLSSQTKGILGKLGMDTIMCYTDTIKSEAKTKDEALKDIAENMRKCWNMWGEGNLNPEGKNIWYGREEKCFTCYKLSFPELEESVSIKDINECLREPEVCTSNKLNGEKRYWNYFKQSNPANMVNVILPGKSENGNVIEKDEIYAIVYNENIEPSKIGRLISSSMVGYYGGTILCGIGVFAGFVSGGAATLLCVPVMTATTTIAGFSDLEIREIIGKLQEKAIADGIMFETYYVAKNNCATVVRVKEEVEFEDVIKNE